MLTVVEEMNPREPGRWQDAAKVVVSGIFDSVTKLVNSLDELEESNRRKIVSSAERSENLENLEIILECLSLLDIQFEGMLNNSKWFESDQMFWAEEWKNLGSIAAAAGIKTGFLDWPNMAGSHPEMQNSASALGAVDNWMLCEEITQTLIRKQTDYGHHNIARFGRHGILVRCHDKIARLKNLHLTRAGSSMNESLMDTYVDIIGYSAIGMMWERGWFLLDLNQ
jgi:hypothetical protein